MTLPEPPEAPPAPPASPSKRASSSNTLLCIGRDPAAAPSVRLAFCLAGDLTPTELEDRAIEQMMADDPVSLYAQCLQTLVGRRPVLDFAEQEWATLLRHRADLEARLGRPVGIQTAALDFFCDARPEMPEVVVVPHDTYVTMATESRIDPTTGVFAPRTFLWALEHEVRRARRYHRHIVLIVVDIDDMQRIASRRGQEYADFVLREVANLVAENIRNTDTAGRIEQDVFGILLHECRLMDGRRLAERLREAIEQQSFALAEGDEGAHITASLGVVGYPESGDGGDKLLTRARALILRAKSQGKNRVEAAEIPF